MTVKQLYEILGNYIDVGAGEWDILFTQRVKFKSIKEHREWAKSNKPQAILNYEVGEVAYAADSEFGTKFAFLLPPLYVKDEKKAFYYLPTEDFVDGKLDYTLGTTLVNRLELVAKGSKKRTKKVPYDEA
jgi:hypothetical protein